MTALPRLSCTAIDCPDARALAAFYADLTGWPVDEDASDDGWVQLRTDGPVTIAFQRVADYQAPAWPGQQHPQQQHLDFTVDDLDEGERHVLAVGARKHETQPGRDFRVYLDPADHPFCLVTP